MPLSSIPVGRTTSLPCPWFPTNLQLGAFTTRPSFRKYWLLVRELHKLAATVNLAFVEVGFVGKRDYPCTTIGTLREDLLKAASMLEHYLSWDYYVRYVNSRNALIAELRWTIRERTGRPHDSELGVLIHLHSRPVDSRKVVISVRLPWTGSKNVKGKVA